MWGICIWAEFVVAVEVLVEPVSVLVLVTVTMGRLGREAGEAWAVLISLSWLLSRAICSSISTSSAQLPCSPVTVVVMAVAMLGWVAWDMLLLCRYLMSVLRKMMDFAWVFVTLGAMGKGSMVATGRGKLVVIWSSSMSMMTPLVLESSSGWLGVTGCSACLSGLSFSWISMSSPLTVSSMIACRGSVARAGTGGVRVGAELSSSSAMSCWCWRVWVARSKPSMSTQMQAWSEGSVGVTNAPSRRPELFRLCGERIISIRSLMLRSSGLVVVLSIISASSIPILVRVSCRAKFLPVLQSWQSLEQCSLAPGLVLPHPRHVQESSLQSCGFLARWCLIALAALSSSQMWKLAMAAPEETMWDSPAWQAYHLPVTF